MQSHDSGCTGHTLLELINSSLVHHLVIASKKKSKLVHSVDLVATVWSTHSSSTKNKIYNVTMSILLRVEQISVIALVADCLASVTTHILQLHKVISLYSKW